MRLFFVSASHRLLTSFVCAGLILNSTPAFALRAPALVESSGLEELSRSFIRSPVSSGLEESATEPDENEDETTPIDRLPVSKLLERILDTDQWEHRQDSEWGALLERYLVLIQQAQGVPPQSRRAEQKMVLAAWHAYSGATRHVMSVDEMLGILRGTGPVSRLAPGVKVGRQVRTRGPDPKYFRQFAVPMAILGNRIVLSTREEAVLGAPQEPQALDGRLDPMEYLRRFHARFVHDTHKENHTALPMYQVGFLDGVNHGDLGDPAPFGLLSVLAARQMGLVPSLRVFPELAAALLDNEVVHVTYLRPIENNPPALRIVFGRPLVDSFLPDEPHATSIVVALLRDSLPEQPSPPERPWTSISEAELLEAAVQGMAVDRESVLFDEGSVRARSFQPEDGPAQRAQKVLDLARLMAEGKVLPRGMYLLEVDLEQKERYARWATRTWNNAWGVQQQVIFRATRILDPEERRRRLAAPSEQRDLFEERLAHRQQALDLLIQFGLPELAQDPEALHRAEQLFQRLSIKGRPFIPLEDDPYRPLCSLPLLRTASGNWLLSEADTVTFLNRLTGHGRILLNPDFKEATRQLAQTLHESDRAAFQAEINHAALRGLLAHDFRNVRMEEVHQTLLARCRLLSGAGAQQSPTALLLHQAERVALLVEISSAQERIWSLLESELEEPVDVDKVLKDLETAAVRLARALFVPAHRLQSLSLKDQPAYLAGLAAIRDEVKQLLVPQVEGAAEDLVRIKLFRGLVEIHRLAAGGQPNHFRQALETAARLVLELRADEMGRLERIQARLRDHLAQQLMVELDRLTADVRILEKADEVSRALQSSGEVLSLLSQEQSQPLRQAREAMVRRFVGEALEEVATAPDQTAEAIARSMALLDGALQVADGFDDFKGGLNRKRDELRQKLDTIRRKAQAVVPLREQEAQTATQTAQLRTWEAALKRTDTPVETAQALQKLRRFQGVLANDRVSREFLQKVSPGAHPNGTKAKAAAERQLERDEVKKTPVLYEFYTALLKVTNSYAGLEESVLDEVTAAQRDGRPLPIFITESNPAGARVSYRGTNGSVIEGFIPMSETLNDPERRMPLTVKMAWLRTQAGRPLQAVPIEIKLQGRYPPTVLFVLRMPITAGTFGDESVFQAEILTRKQPGKIAAFLSWLLEERLDPQWNLIEWHAYPAWQGLLEGQRLEIIRWLVEHARLSSAVSALFGFFEDVSKTEKWDDTRLAAVKGMAEMADSPEKRGRVLTAVQRLWSDSAASRSPHQGRLRPGLLSIAGTLGIPSAENWRAEALSESDADFAVKWFGMQSALAEVTMAISQGRRLPMLIEWVDEQHGMGAHVSYRGTNEVRVDGFLPASEVFRDPQRQISLEAKMAWLLAREGQTLEATPLSVDLARESPRIVFSLNRPIGTETFVEAGIFEAQILRMREASSILPFLARLVREGADPRPRILAWSSGEDWNLLDAEKQETITWWLKRQNLEDAKSPQSGLEESFVPMLEKNVERPLRLLAEVAQGGRAVLIGPEALARMAGLEELLNRAPPELANRLMVLTGPQSAQRLTNRRLRKFTDPDDAVIALAGQAGLEQVIAFGLGPAEPQVLRSAPLLGLSIRSLGITGQSFQEFLWLIAQALGAPIPQLAPYFDPAGLEEAVREAA